MTAYARQGRQACDRRSSSAVVVLPVIRRRTRSPVGNASGSPSARIATYEAVHGPMPGSAVRLVMTSALSASGESVKAPSGQRAGQPPNRLGPRRHDADMLERRVRQLCRGREQTIDAAMRVTTADPNARRQPPGDCRRCPDRAPVGRASARTASLEAVPRARHPDARVMRRAMGAAVGRRRGASRSPPDRRQDRTSSARVRRSKGGRGDRETERQGRSQVSNRCGNTSIVPERPSTSIVRW